MYLSTKYLYKKNLDTVNVCVFYIVTHGLIKKYTFWMLSKIICMKMFLKIKNKKTTLLDSAGSKISDGVHCGSQDAKVDD